MSDQAPPMPAPIRAVLAQIAGMRAQLDALTLSVEALGYGMLAGAARQRQAPRPEPGGIGPVFGASPTPPSTADVSATTERALSALEVPSPSSEVSP